jgi:hypothetical protein
MEEDEISLKELFQKMKELFQYFWTFRFWIALIGLTGGGLGFAYAHFFKEVQYTSKRSRPGFQQNRTESGPSGFFNHP